MRSLVLQRKGRRGWIGGRIRWRRRRRWRVRRRRVRGLGLGLWGRLVGGVCWFLFVWGRWGLGMGWDVGRGHTGFGGETDGCGGGGGGGGRSGWHGWWFCSLVVCGEGNGDDVEGRRLEWHITSLVLLELGAGLGRHSPVQVFSSRDTSPVDDRLYQMEFRRRWNRHTDGDRLLSLVCPIEVPYTAYITLEVS